MAIYRLQRLTNLHGAEAPLKDGYHIVSQVCTAPKPRGVTTITMGHKLAWGLSAVQIPPAPLHSPIHKTLRLDTGLRR